MSTLPDAIKAAAGMVDQHRGVVCLALQTDSESLRLAAIRFRNKAIHHLANERDDESGLAGHVATALANFSNTPAHWVEHHWQTILAAVVRREAADLAHRQSILKWLGGYEGPTDAPVFKTQSWQYKSAGERAEALAEVKAALTAVRDASTPAAA
ncbi:hypothetical protein [Streptomyces sp. C]|uniref:hypothetical protein n=1 Tax=Streptomyces sp. C TaxID=253839 RepID=UPI0001B53C61|nr:hypothetical protein [Streptomyces sp. C]